MMGEIAVRLADYTIVTTDDPHGEKPESIIDEIAAGFVGDESRNSIVENRKWEALIDRKKAIEKALKMAKAGDIVLIAGRGHEKYQDFAGKKIPLDDKEVVKEILG